MAFSVVMPALEMAQETGKLVAWRKKEGESVAKGELLLEVETDKAVMEIESPADGVLAGVKVYEGAVVPVGQTIAWIVRPGETPPSEVAAATSVSRAADEPVRHRPAVPSPPQPPDAPGVKISPKARRLAKESGVDLSRLHGSGPGGEILASDILAMAEGSPGATGVEPLSPTARLMAERTTASWTTVPHFFVTREIDAGAMIRAREQLGPAIEHGHQVKLTYTDLLVAVVSRVLAKHPRLNASWSGAGIRLNPEVNVGVAMAVEDGVVAAVIHQANLTDLGQIARQGRDLAERARAGRLRPSDITGATFTISNLGMYQVDGFTAIVNAPQAAILAVGSISDRVVPVDGQPGIRPMMRLTLSCDHRVVDGARAALFLNDLVEALRRPEERLR